LQELSQKDLGKFASKICGEFGLPKHHSFFQSLCFPQRLGGILLNRMKEIKKKNEKHGK